jgi:hypothetical protein
LRSGRLKGIDDLAGRDPRSNAVDRPKQNSTFGVDNEDGWAGYAAALVRIEDSPIPHHPAIGVAQNPKRQVELAAQRFGPARLVDGDRDQIGARGADLGVMIPIIRQLADTERSPEAAIEEHDEPAASGKGRQARWDPG